MFGAHTAGCCWSVCSISVARVCFCSEVTQTHNDSRTQVPQREGCHASVCSQVMVFVHARNATVRTAMGLIEMAKNRGETSFFQPEQGPDYGQCDKQVGVLARRPWSSSHLHICSPCLWLCTPALVVVPYHSISFEGFCCLIWCLC